jgi:hypothetical protein
LFNLVISSYWLLFKLDIRNISITERYILTIQLFYSVQISL